MRIALSAWGMAIYSLKLIPQISCAVKKRVPKECVLCISIHINSKAGKIKQHIVQDAHGDAKTTEGGKENDHRNRGSGSLGAREDGVKDGAPAAPRCWRGSRVQAPQSF